LATTDARLQPGALPQTIGDAKQLQRAFENLFTDGVKGAGRPRCTGTGMRVINADGGSMADEFFLLAGYHVFDNVAS